MKKVKLEWFNPDARATPTTAARANILISKLAINVRGHTQHELLIRLIFDDDLNVKTNFHRDILDQSVCHFIQCNLISYQCDNQIKQVFFIFNFKGTFSE